MATGTGDAECGHGDDGQDQAEDEAQDGADARAVGEADQGIGGHGADGERDGRAEQRHDHRVAIGAQRVAEHGAEQVLPGVERRLEVNERQVEWALVDVERQLERGDREPVEREQDDEGPKPQEEVGDRPCPSGESSSRPRGRRAVVTGRPAAPRQAHEGEAAEGDNEQEDVGHCRRAAEVERAPGHEGVQGQGFRGDARAAIGQHVGQVDDLERLDHADQDQRDADRQDGRDGQVAEHLPAAKRRRPSPPRPDPAAAIPGWPGAR